METKIKVVKNENQDPKIEGIPEDKIVLFFLGVSMAVVIAYILVLRKVFVN